MISQGLYYIYIYNIYIPFNSDSDLFHIIFTATYNSFHTSNSIYHHTPSSLLALPNRRACCIVVVMIIFVRCEVFQTWMVSLCTCKTHQSITLPYYTYIFTLAYFSNHNEKYCKYIFWSGLWLRRPGAGDPQSIAPQFGQMRGIYKRSEFMKRK